MYSAMGLDVLFWFVSPLYSMNSYYIFYVYTRCELGISGKQIFYVLARVHQDGRTHVHHYRPSIGGF